MGTHLAAGRNGLKRHGERACPIDFERHLVAAGDFISDFVLLAGHHFFAALGRSANARQVIAAPLGKKLAGENFDDDFGREELLDFVADCSGFDCFEILPGDREVLRSSARVTVS